jgi:hypothetical protein
MKKFALVCIFIIIVTSMLPACSVITGSTDNSPVVTDTPFGKMLAKVPYSYLEEHDVWFGNMKLAKDLNGMSGINTYEDMKTAMKQLPEAQYRQFSGDFNIATTMFPNLSHTERLVPLVGFGVTSLDRYLVINSVPPRITCLATGEIDEASIADKLTALGYTVTDYGRYFYYGKGDDFQLDIASPLGGLVLNSMNRVAAVDGTVIFSPDTADVTGIFDAISGTAPSVIDNTACGYLVNGLGDVLAATITTPDRVIYSDLSGQPDVPKLSITIPPDWGTLRGYQAVALGYRPDGDQRYFDIVLYYKNKADAVADGNEIIKRLQRYKMGTYLPDLPDSGDLAFTSAWQPGQPVVTEYSGGAVLKISCLSVSEVPRGVSTLLGGQGMGIRDVLFLAPDPAQYTVIGR